MDAERARSPTGVRPGHRIDTAASVALVVLAWLGAALALGAVLFAMTFLDDCSRPACDVPRGVHVFVAGAAVTAVVALLGARWTFARPDRRHRWLLALLVLVVVLGCVVATTAGAYAGLDLHPELFERAQLR